MCAQFRAKFREFDNGLRLISIPSGAVNAGTISYLVGSREDPDWFEGAAHTAEHLLIRGTHKDRLRRDMSGYGSDPVRDRDLYRLMRRHQGGTDGDGMGVYTMHAYTSYGCGDMFTRKILFEVLDSYAKTLRDGMYDIHKDPNLDPILTEFALAVEKAAVDNETALSLEDVSSLVSYHATRLLYEKNPVRRWGFGDEQHLKDVTLDGLKRWSRQYYVPRNMQVILVGPTLTEGTKFIKRNELDQLPDWPLTDEYPNHDDFVPMLDRVKQKRIRRIGQKVTHIFLAWPTGTSTCDDSHALEVLIDVVKERVETEVRDRNTLMPGGVYHPAAGWDSSPTHGYFWVWLATTGDDAHVRELIERTHHVIRHIKEDRSLLLDEDVMDHQMFLINSFNDSIATGSTALYDMVLEALTCGDEGLSGPKEYVEKMGKVTPQKIRNAARMYLSEDRHVEVIIGP